MPQEKDAKTPKHSPDTRSVLFWVNKQKFAEWTEFAEKMKITMTQLIIRGVDDVIKSGMVDISADDRLKALEARNDEIVAKLDALYKQNAEIVKDDASVNDSTIQEWVISVLRAKGGDARDDEIAEWMNKDHDFIVDVLSVMLTRGKVVQDKVYGRWSLP